MPKYGYLVVEGPHDIEFVYRLLSPLGLRRIRLEADGDPFFTPLIPHDYPPDGDLQERMPVPLFLQSGTHAIAVHGAAGDARLIQTLEENTVLIGLAGLTGVGIILDADTDQSPVDRYVTIRDQLRAKNLAFPDDAGVVSPTTPRLGAFVLPDNQAPGTLEDILLECGQLVYAGLLSTATHVNAASQDPSLLNEDLEELRKPAGRIKAIVGSIASILRPGKAVQVSIQDNRWLRDSAALAIPRVRAVQDFLTNLLELP
jgi:hypothetical protein